MANRRASIAATWARRALALYPRAWRDRYAEEVAALLQEHRATAWTVADIVLGALDAHLHRGLLPGRLTTTVYRIRTSEIVIFCAFVLFGVAWVAAQQVRDPLPEWERIIQQHPDVRAALIAMQLAGVVALLAILIGGLPMVFAVFRGAKAEARGGILWLLATPLLAFLALIGAVIAAAWIWSNTHQASGPLPGGWQLVLLIVFVLALGGSTLALALAVKRGRVSERLVRFALVPAALAVAGIVAGLVATGVLTALSITEAPELGSANLAILTAVMALATIIALLALGRGIAAARPARG